MYIAWSLQWSSDVVEKREFAGKKAKLASAELAKLSRRVFGEHIYFLPYLVYLLRLFLYKICSAPSFFFQTIQPGILICHILLPR